MRSQKEFDEDARFRVDSWEQEIAEDRAAAEEEESARMADMMDAADTAAFFEERERLRALAAEKGCAGIDNYIDPE